MKETRLTSAEYIGRGRHLMVTGRMTTTYPLHAHNYFEIEYVLGGEGKQYLNGKPYPMRRGGLFLMTPSDFHRIEAEEKGDLWNISFDETFVSAKMLSALLAGGFALQADEALTAKLTAVSELLFAEQNNEEAAKLLLSYLLGLIVKPTAAANATDAVSRAVSYLELHFKESPSLSEMAEVICLSPSYFGELFKKSLGVTYLAYLNDRKLHSASLLLQNGMPVSEAAFSSGFGSLSGFLYAFKKKYGVSPSDYRQKHLGSGKIG